MCPGPISTIEGNYYTTSEEPIPSPEKAGVVVDHYKIPLICSEENCGGRLQHVNASKSLVTAATAIAACLKCKGTFAIQVQMRKLPKESRKRS